MGENWIRAIQLINRLQQNKIVLTEAMNIVSPMHKYRSVAKKISYADIDITKEDLDVIEHVIQVYIGL